MPATIFDGESIDRHEWYRATAERVGNTFATRGCQPDLEVMLQGVVDYAEQSGRAVCDSFPNVQEDLIHADMVELAVQILAKTCASDGTRHARRSNGNRVRNLYLERMRAAIVGQASVPARQP